MDSWTETPINNVVYGRLRVDLSVACVFDDNHSILSAIRQDAQAILIEKVDRGVYGEARAILVELWREIEQYRDYHPRCPVADKLSALQKSLSFQTIPEDLDKKAGDSARDYIPKYDPNRTLF